MKKFLKISIILFIAFTLVGCSKEEENSKDNNGSKVEDRERKSEASFKVKEDTITSKSATFILENNSDIKLQYDEPYEIYVKKDYGWEKIEVDTYFIEPLYYLDPGKSVELKFEWETFYGSLEKGEYKLVKTGAYSYGRKYESFDMDGFFTIK